MRKRRLVGVLMIIVALIVMTIPVTEADAQTSASDFIMDGNTLVRYKGTDKNVSIPASVEEIAESAFEDNLTIEKLTIPNSIRLIGAYAFWGCNNLKNITIGSGLKEIGDYAFTGCKGLTSMVLPKNIVSIGIQAFGDCINMTDITIPAETMQIHDSAFDGCGKLTIHCEAGTVAAAFAEKFQNLQSEIPEYEDVPGYQPEEDKPSDSDTEGEDSVPERPLTEEELIDKIKQEAGEAIGSSKVVGNRAMIFISEEDLKVMQSQPQVDTQVLPLGELFDETLAGKLPKYTIVDGTVVADQAYYRNADMQALEIPIGIQEIGEFSFARSTVGKIVIPEGVTDIAYGAFYHCDNLKEVQLPFSLRSIEPKAFAETAWINDFYQSGDIFLISGNALIAYNGTNEKVVIPDSVEIIAAGAFEGHEEIKSLVLPDSLLVIGEDSFVNCSSLENIEFGNGILQIKDRAFFGCENLMAVKLPNSIEQIGLKAFGGATVQYEGATPKLTYEKTATRLSNVKFREGVQFGNDSEEKQDGNINGSFQDDASPRILVSGTDMVEAYLESMDQNYFLEVTKQDTSSKLENACQRAFGTALPENIELYGLLLSDESGVSIVKLGRNKLSVVMELPEKFLGQKLQVLSIDRNGQAVLLESEKGLKDGKEVLCFDTDFVSEYGIYAIGEDSAQLKEISADMTALSGPDVLRTKDTIPVLMLTKFIFALLLLFIGSLLLLGLRKI